MKGEPRPEVPKAAAGEDGGVPESEWGSFISAFAVFDRLVHVVNGERGVDSHPDGSDMEKLFKDNLPAYIAQCKASALKQGIELKSFVLILDGATCHHTDDVKEVCRGLGVKLVKLPARSPDLNPIENIWHMLKTRLRRRHFSTLPELRDALDESWAELLSERADNIMEQCADYAKKCGEVIQAAGRFTGAR